MPTPTRQIAKDDTILTSTLSSGLLKPEQASKFIQQTFDATRLGSLVRHVTKKAKTGEIDKIGIANRIIRKKVENTDDGYRAKPITSQIEYACKAVRLPWEITEETLRENIEGENLEKIITDLMTTQLGIDLIDLYLNGDESMNNAKAFSESTTYKVGDVCTYNGKIYVFNAEHQNGSWSGDDTTEIGNASDVDFLKIDTGWIKQIEDGGHIVDNGNKELSLDMFYNLLRAVPNKYNNGKLRWIMSPHMKQNWERSLYNATVSNGSTAPESMYNAPAGIPIETEAMFADDKIMITDPKNLIITNTYDVKIRKTTEGKEAIMQDKRFYVIHLDFDTLIEELDATGLITNINANL